VSLETAVQNPGIGFIVMQSNLESPYSEIGSLPIIAYLLVATGPPMICVLIIIKTIEFIRNKRGGEGELESLKAPTKVKTDSPAALDNPVPVSDNL